MTCSICGKEPATPCGGCSSVSYCGKDCQKKDWKQHKSKCKNYKVITSQEEHGRHAIASRDIQPGESIIVCSPLVVGPMLFEPMPCCLGCHAKVGKLGECEDCHLPVCSKKCQGSVQHQMECTLISKHKANALSTTDDSEFRIGLEAVLTLRVIALKFTKPELFDLFLSFESNTAEIKKGGRWRSHCKSVLDPVLALDIQGITSPIIQTIIGVIMTNCFEVVSKGTLLTGFYPEASFMNHDCVGNVRVSMDGSNTLTVMACIRIKKNTPIKFNYVKPLDTTWSRQVHLNENKFFTCNCQRCVDPTELGTYLSAHRCGKDDCCGYLLPTNTHSMLDDWKCDKCNQIIGADSIKKTLKSLQQESDKVDKNSMVDLKKILNKYSKKLHRNHGILTELKQFIISGYGRFPGFQVEDMSEGDHKYKIQLCHEVMSVLNILEPGLNLGRGLMMFEVHTSLVILANLEFERNHNHNQLLVRLLEAEKYLRESEIILKKESKTSPYGHLAHTISQNMLDLANYIESVKQM